MKKQKGLKIGLFSAFLWWCLVGCSPKNEDTGYTKVADGQMQEREVDSVKRKTEKDGTLVLEAEKDDRRQLPGNLVGLLDSLHAGWSLPAIEKEALQEAYGLPQGPFFVSGFYNADTFKDHVVQIREGKAIKVLAYINSGSETTEFLISQFRLVPEKNILESPVRLLPVTKNEPSGTDGFKISTGSDSAYYIFRNGKFLPVSGVE